MSNEIAFAIGILDWDGTTGSSPSFGDSPNSWGCLTIEKAIGVFTHVASAVIESSELVAWAKKADVFGLSSNKNWSDYWKFHEISDLLLIY